MTKPLAVLIGFIGKIPLAGMTLNNTHYIAGLQELGYDVHYVERQSGPEDYYDPRMNQMTADMTYGAAYTERALQEFNIGPAQLSLIDAEGRCGGSGWPVLEQALDRAEFVLALADPAWFEELERCPRRAFVDVDPLFTQAAMLKGGQLATNVGNYGVLFTYGARMGQPDCLVPDAGREWIATRPVVCTRMWRSVIPDDPQSLPITNLMNWSAGAEIEVGGRVYRQKSHELERFIDMPAIARDSFMLAIGGAAPKERLRQHGWTLANPLEVTATVPAYREFISGSRADFGIAKHAYVASRSGWFSDRSICYLASGRPVLHQDTGFPDWLPAGDGVFPFAAADDVVKALNELAANYSHHSHSARMIAETHFEARTVIAQMLDSAGFRA